ncbi:MAG: hypothetical protein IJ816_03255 [Alloprevotella sp.]|nr:hypothetical protein [Alloprevotella sp.]
MRNKILIYTAQFLSVIFQPFYMPVVAFVVLLMFSYLNNLPLAYKAVLVFAIYVFTVLLPRTAIFLYRKSNGWSRFHLSKRINRYVPYALSILSYGILLYFMYRIHMPSFAIAVIVAAFVLQIICVLINTRTKISTHAAAAGSLTGAIVGFALLFHFNLLPWLCVCVLLCGLVGTARLILRQHSLLDIWLGTLIGFFCGFFCVLLM